MMIQLHMGSPSRTEGPMMLRADWSVNHDSFWAPLQADPQDPSGLLGGVRTSACVRTHRGRSGRA